MPKKSASVRSRATSPWKFSAAFIILILLTILVALMAYLGSYNTNNIEVITQAAGPGTRADYGGRPDLPPGGRFTSPTPVIDICPLPPCAEGDLACVQGYDPSWCLSTPQPRVSPSPRPSGSASPLPLPPQPTPQPGATALVSAELVITEDHPTNYCVNLVVTNTTSAAVKSWYVQLKLNDSQITSSSGGHFTNLFGQTIIRPDQNTSDLPAGSKNSSVSFCAEKAGVNWRPSRLRLSYR